MALRKCPDCEKDISESAAICIHCGCPLKVDLKNGASPGTSEAIKQGTQKSKLRNDLGGAIAFIGLPTALVAGMATSSAIGWGSAVAVCIAAVWVTYS